MKTKAKTHFNISKFESISQNMDDRLVGGFSTTFFSSEKEFDQGANNCSGGNCSANCGNGQNVGCNVTFGCST